LQKNSQVAPLRLDGHSLSWYNTAMQSIFTATYTVHDHVAKETLHEETRILVGVDPQNLQWFNNPNETTFTITDMLDPEVEPNEYFTQIAKDYERRFQVKVLLGEVIVED